MADDVKLNDLDISYAAALGGVANRLQQKTYTGQDIEEAFEELRKYKRSDYTPSSYEVVRPTQLNTIAQAVYGSGDRKYTELIRRWNVIEFFEYGSELRRSGTLVDGKYVDRIGTDIAPHIATTGEDITLVAAGQTLTIPLPTTENLTYTSPEPIPTLEYKADLIRIRSALTAFLALRGEEQKYIPKKAGLGLVLFKSVTHLDSDRPRVKKAEEVHDRVSRCVTHESLFEGVCGLEFEVPLENSDPFLFRWRVGDTVMLTFDGTVVFMGVLVKPKIKTKGGKTITWTAQSHSCVYVRSHMNPQNFQAGWTSMTPLQIIAELAETLGLPLEISPYAVSELSRQMFDQEQLSEINADVTTTTPFSFINRLAKSAGFNVTSSRYGYFSIQEVRTDAPRVGDYVEGEDSVEFSADYDYGDVARTYTVLSQRREANEYGSCVFEPFPPQLQVFKNVTTDLSVFSSLAEAAEFEAVRSVTDAIKVTMELPQWLDKTGTPWELGRKVGVQSPTCLLFGQSYASEQGRIPIDMIVSGVDFVWTDKNQAATITLALPESFLPLVRKIQTDLPVSVTNNLGLLNSLTEEELDYYRSSYERPEITHPPYLPFLNFGASVGFGKGLPTGFTRRLSVGGGYYIIEKERR